MLSSILSSLLYTLWKKWYLFQRFLGGNRFLYSSLIREIWILEDILH